MDRDLYIDEQAELLSQIGNAHLFIIGIDAYKNGISPLNNCVRDAEKLKKILTEKYHFPVEKVKTLYNEDASLRNIIRQLGFYTGNLTEKDSLLISFSGHGFYKNEIGYLVPSDAENGEFFGLLNNDDLKSYLKSCKAKHILLVVDSCYSGSFLLKDKDGNEQKSLANEVAKYKSRWVLAAGRIEKVADGEYGKHSPFATTLHTYLEKNTDKVFCISDLAQYVKNITPRNANQFPIAGVLENTNDEGGEFVFFPRNNEKEDFALCKTKADFIHFLQKYKDASPAHITHANAQIKAFEEKEIAEKAASQREKAHHLYATILAEQDWEKKNELVNEYKNRFSEIEEELYLSVLDEGTKADDYPEWKKVNKSSVNAIELFIRKHKHNFFVAEAKVLLKEAEKAKKNAINLQEEEEKRKQAELNRLAEMEKVRLEKEEQDRKDAEQKCLAEIEKARLEKEVQDRAEAEQKRLAEIEKARLEKEVQDRIDVEQKRLAEIEKVRLVQAEEERKAAEKLRLEKEKAEKVRLAQVAKEAEEKRQVQEKLRLEKEQKAAEENRLKMAANLKEREEKKREESENAWAVRKAFLSKYRYVFVIIPFFIGFLWVVNGYMKEDRESEAQKNREDSTALIDSIAKVQAEAMANELAQHLQDSLGKDGIINLFPMIYVKGGTFMMGSNEGEDDEKPVHSVTLSDFSIGKTEVTQKQWQAVMGNNPSNFKCEDCPVEQVSWNKVQEFIQKLNKLTEKKYSLPSEAQWEFAARGGTKSKGYKYAGSNDLGEVGWYDKKSEYKTHKVATKKPNELGLYDMSGNVWEWCQDYYDKDFYSNNKNKNNPRNESEKEGVVLRGGSWHDNSYNLRLADRLNYYPNDYSVNVGFRVVVSSGL